MNWDWEWKRLSNLNTQLTVLHRTKQLIQLFCFSSLCFSVSTMGNHTHSRSSACKSERTVIQWFRKSLVLKRWGVEVPLRKDHPNLRAIHNLVSFFYSDTWPSYSVNVLSLRLIGAVERSREGALLRRLSQKSSFRQICQPIVFPWLPSKSHRAASSSIRHSKQCWVVVNGYSLLTSKWI